MPFGQNKKCTVCSAPPEVLVTVEQRLRDGTKLRDLAALSGFSVSALHRHRVGCMRKSAMLANRNARKPSLQGKRMLVELSAHPLTGDRHRYLLSAEYDARSSVTRQPRPGEEIEVTANDLRSDDVVLVLEFEEAKPARVLPAAIDNDEHTSLSPTSVQTQAADPVAARPESELRMAPSRAPELLPPPPAAPTINDKVARQFARVARLRLPWC